MEAAAQGMITTVAVAECGCAVEAGAAGFSIRQCPTHAAAPAMLAALEAITEEWYGLWVGSHSKFSPAEVKYAQQVEASARAAIALARGEVK